MDSLIRKIAAVLGIKSLSDTEQERMSKIADLVTCKPSDAGFEDDVLAAELKVASQASGAGGMALWGSMMQVTAPPPERVYKIKRVAKGKRIAEKSPSGRNFAFGPKWCAEVRACKSLALNENNREKLNMHGKTLGIEHPEKMAPRELCLAIAARMPEEA